MFNYRKKSQFYKITQSIIKNHILMNIPDLFSTVLNIIKTMLDTLSNSLFYARFYFQLQPLVVL